jgi:hypothetical protein
VGILRAHVCERVCVCLLCVCVCVCVCVCMCGCLCVVCACLHTVRFMPRCACFAWCVVMRLHSHPLLTPTDPHTLRPWALVYPQVSASCRFTFGTLFLDESMRPPRFPFDTRALLRSH